MSGPPILEFFVEHFFRGKRVDSFLERHLRSYTEFQIHRLLRADCVWVNDCQADCNTRVKTNDCVRVRLISPPDRCADADPIPIEILFEDAWLLVVNKPPGQMAHPGGKFQTRTLMNAIQYHLDQQTKQPGLLRPGIVHRIDRQTSGVMVVPKDHISHRVMTAQFEHKRVSKSYRAIVHGRVANDTGRIDMPIGLIPNIYSSLMCAKPCARDPRPATTSYRVLERFADYTFVEALPLTGRHHQIRIHFSEIGHPLLADEFYGPFGEIKDGTPLFTPDVKPELSNASTQVDDDEEFEEPAESPFFDPALPLRRHALHAASLSIAHPISGLAMGFDAPLPPDMQETLTFLQRNG